MKYLFPIFAIATFTFFACNSESSKNLDFKAEITALEDSIFTKDGGINPMQQENGRKLTDVYEQYAASGVEDSVAIENLYKAAAIAKNVNRSYAKSIQLLNKIYTDYPDSPRAADAKFMEAFTYANDLQDYDKAKKLYDEFLNQYPNHPMFEAAISEVKNLGKTPEMMIEEFKKNQPVE